MDKRTVSAASPAYELLKRVKIGSKTRPEDLSWAAPMAAAPYYAGYGSSSSDNTQAIGTQSTDSEAANMLFVAPETEARMQTAEAITHVLSATTEEFSNYYEAGEELGRGAFSVVRKCVNKQSGEICAVKIIDLRPLRLRENFNPTRLRREVDIMKRLRHPNIVTFVDVFETTDQLLVVMEYAPGTELFDMILAKKRYPEHEAKWVFAQVARALCYLHSINIVHRDIKPENIVVMDRIDPVVGLPVVKLLDFGLSKMIGTDAGSMAKTFVGTPCYLAPEVEMAAHRKDTSYGTPVDCWSAGAVLYVTLVARFPEFKAVDGKMFVNLSTAIWADVSDEAKDLIRRLMTHNPAVRLTMRQALQHPWLGPYRATDAELATMGKPSPLPTPPTSTSSLESATPMDRAEGSSALVVMQPPADIRPLLQLQRHIASCFESVHKAYLGYPPVASEVRKGAVLCRTQLVETTKLLRTVEQTAANVLNLFPDLELAIEDGEPRLAEDFFNVVKSWVVELRQALQGTQASNRQGMQQIQAIIERSAIAVHALQKGGDSNRLTYENSDTTAAPVVTTPASKLITNGRVSTPISGDSRKRAPATEESPMLTDAVKRLQQAALDQKELTDDQLQDLFMNLFPSSQPQQSHPVSVTKDRHPQSSTPTHEAMPSSPTTPQRPPIIEKAREGEPAGDGGSISMERSTTNEYPNDFAFQQLGQALTKLYEVDHILEQLTVFWASTEVVLDMLTKKGEHVEKFISFAHKPRLLQRFQERLEDYRRYWVQIRDMCAHYVAGVGPRQRMYTFLDEPYSMNSEQSENSACPACVDVDRIDSL